MYSKKIGVYARGLFASITEKRLANAFSGDLGAQNIKIFTSAPTMGAPHGDSSPS